MPGYFDKLKDNDIKVIGILGNDDLEMVEPAYNELISKYENIINIDNKKYDFAGISFIGLNKVLDTPFFRKDHIVVEDGQIMPKQRHNDIYVDGCSRVVSCEEWEELRKTSVPRMEDCLQNLPKATKGYKTIYVIHGPPYGYGLDNCQDGDLPGSKAITKFLENSNAYMSFHGHIHESPKISGKWYNKIVNTISIQPGQSELNEDYFVYVIVDTDENKYERYVIDM